MSAHEGPQETGALAVAGVAQVRGRSGAAHRALPAHTMVATPPWVARRALTAQKMVAAPHWAKPAVCGEQGCSTAPAGAAPCQRCQAPWVASSLPTRRELWASCQTRCEGGPPLAAIPCLCYVVTSVAWPCGHHHVLGATCLL